MDHNDVEEVRALKRDVLARLHDVIRHAQDTNYQFTLMAHQISTLRAEIGQMRADIRKSAPKPARLVGAATHEHYGRVRGLADAVQLASAANPGSCVISITDALAIAQLAMCAFDDETWSSTGVGLVRISPGFSPAQQ